MLPLTYALEGLRGALMRGQSLYEIRDSIVALVAFNLILIPLGLVAFRYALAPAIEQAIKKTGKADRKAIRDALETVDVADTPVGRIRFDDTHQAFINMLLVQINGGQLKLLEKIVIQP